MIFDKSTNNAHKNEFIIFLISLLFIVSCSSTDSGVSNEQNTGIAWLSIDSSHINTDSGDTTRASLSGEAFISSDYTATTCAGLACLLYWYDDAYPGVNVSWDNLTTGATGDATSRYGTATSFEHLWYAYPTVSLGVNRIRVTAADPAGNVASTIITLESGPDVLPPSVVSTKPTDGEAFVMPYEPVTVWFSESVDPATVNENTFEIAMVDGTAVGGTINVSVSESGTSATLFGADLAPNTNYYVTITTGISDISGKPLSNNYTWSFSTGEGDFTPPSVIESVPQAGATDVSIFKNISVTFSELINHATLTTSSFTVLDALGNQVEGSVSITSSGSVDVASFTPSAPLQSSTTYTATITAALADLAGNTMPGDYSWSFTTMPPDTAPPSVQGIEPLSGETCVPLDKMVSVTFDEEMDASSLNTSTFLLSDLDNSPVSGEILNSGAISVFDPYASLAYGTGYRATITTGAKDRSGNPLSSDYTWQFITETGSKGSWAPLSTSGAPSGRRSHTAVWTGSEMIVWGGGWNDVTNTGGRYNLLSDSWQPTNTTDAPSARIGHTSVWTGSEMIVWGGRDYNDTRFNSGARYDPATDTWHPTSLNGAPTPREDHVAVWTGSEMIIWGGNDGTQSLNNGARYNPSTDTWQSISTTAAPQYNYGVGWGKATWTGNKMILLNQYNFNPDNGGIYDPSTDTWKTMSPDGAPPYGTKIQYIAWTGSELLVWGSYYFSTYNPLSDSWQQLPVTCSPSYREFLDGVWTDSEMIIWGGLTGSSRLDSGGIYSLSTNLWSSTSLMNAPSPRSGHKALWTGNEMLIWGGVHGVDSGGKYTP